jgi:hypothetical protein
MRKLVLTICQVAQDRGWIVWIDIRLRVNTIRYIAEFWKQTAHGFMCRSEVVKIAHALLLI